jgi:hypothetical protein
VYLFHRTVIPNDLSLMLPFTVTRFVTSRDLSIAVESRDANLVFGKIS